MSAASAHVAVPPLQRELFAPSVARHLDTVAEIKRLFDRWAADAEFRAHGLANATPAGIPADALRPFFESDVPFPDDAPPAVRLFASYLRQRQLHRVRMRDGCTPTHPDFRAWRERQILRCHGQLPPRYNQAIVHLPVAFELSEGCSVGCWFCGLSAGRLQSAFEATPQNRRFWRDVLTVFRDVCGEAIGRGVCFAATDPLDNPGYEDFCLDFHDVLGRFPPTTTALAHKDFARTEALMTLSWTHGCEYNRFSVLSLRTLEAIFGQFSPQALLYVDMVAQTAGAVLPKARAGRAVEHAARQHELTAEPSTIACVSGFLVNMVTRTLRLVSPCEAGPKWPLGYRVHTTAVFNEPAHLNTLINEMIHQHMSPRLRIDDPVAWRADLSMRAAGRTLTAVSPCGGASSLNLAVDAEALAPLLSDGRYSAADVALALETQDFNLEGTFDALHRLFDAGWLDDEPRTVAKEEV